MNLTEKNYIDLTRYLSRQINLIFRLSRQVVIIISVSWPKVIETSSDLYYDLLN